jgi:DNA-directed RNA polymerase subunit M/transcription elongation factor TFIIS
VILFKVPKITTKYMNLRDFGSQLCDKCGTYMVPHKTISGYVKCHHCGYQKMENPIITLESYLMDRHITYKNEYTKEIEQNAKNLLDKINAFLHEIGIKERKVNSGWRPAGINDTTQNAAKGSNHLKALAIDLEDKNGDLRTLVLKNLDKAKQYGIYFEDMRWTKGWIHMQIVPPKSGKRIYIPSTAPALDPNAWSGFYDKKYD